MKLLFDIGHPGHVHLFRNCINTLSGTGNEITLTARDKESTLQLLKAYKLDYTLRGGLRESMLKKAFNLFSTDYRLLRIARDFNPDILIGVHNPYIAHVAKLLGKPSITFTDTENVGVASNLTFPFTDTICTPSCFLEKLNSNKHVKYNGFHEIAYLHPDYFKPDLMVLDELGLTKNDDFIILRFISWAASHDVGLQGIQKGSELDFIKKLEDYGRVFITSERRLSSALESYRINIPVDKMHSLMHYARLYLGEGGTMAVESALLGTPAIHVESNSRGEATGNYSGNFLELRDKYDMLYFYPNQKQALDKAIELLEDKNIKNRWGAKKDKLFREKIDVTAWMTDFIERYPMSFREYKNG
ncbi:MAG: hypothetical protein B6U97_04975 [Candidatus Altiarchaeales archaeon ex4484_96]|nr:MAG: hypothetical protein B6U97_04975 [Candidatus Altiarchaeales archaeon ex4484_96]